MSAAKLKLSQNASYRIDADHKIIIGLPPPEVDKISSWRNYDLAGSIRQLYLRVRLYARYQVIALTFRLRIADTEQWHYRGPV